MKPKSPINPHFFERDPLTCARDLIGKTLLWNGVGGRVVETEAYAEHGDEACHTFFRPSARDFVTRNSAGTIYTYLNYGVHWLFNILVKDASGGENGFVLLRALEPTIDLAIMCERRGRSRPRDLCSGPGKLTQALGIDGNSHGKSIHAESACCFLEDGAEDSTLSKEEPRVVADVRVGISRATDLPWRFLSAGSPHVSVRARQP